MPSKEPKRIVFTCDTPNDQGGIITNDVIDFSRFKKNPVVLSNHDWESDPLGFWTDIKEEGGQFTGVPTFHGLTPESVKYRDLYEGGWLRASSIGGLSVWKQDAAGREELKNGLKQCEKFYLYEISLVTLPSNPDAVQMEAVDLAALKPKLYTQQEIESISNSITKLSSKFNKMSEVKKPENIQEEKTTSEVVLSKEELEATKLAATDGQKLPSVIEKIIGQVVGEGIVNKLFHSSTKIDATKLAPTPEDTPKETAPDKKDINVPQPTPIGMAAEDVEKAKEKAEACVNKAKEAEEKAKKEDATDADKEEYKKCKAEADDAMSALKAAEDKFASLSTNSASPLAATVTKNSISMNKPQLKTREELAAAHAKLAPAPENHAARVGRLSEGVTFTTLSRKAKKDPESNEAKILNHVMGKDGQKDLTEYAVVLNSILNDPKYEAFAQKTRVIPNVAESQIQGYRKNSHNVGLGMTLKDMAVQLQSGAVEAWDPASNQMRRISKFSSTDNALASPALNTIEWLPLAIFNLFPSTSWKNEIPIFPAQITGANTGLIWANIAAQPTVTRGTQPSAPANYTYSDTAVALSLTPYWLQPMLWTPLTMHQLRYDQMGTGWAQAFAYWGSVMDDFLLYTLASTVPASSVILSSGISGYNAATPQSFNISGASSPDSFLLNPAFSGSLLTPTLNDIIRTEQIYRKQNFMLEKEKAIMVVDPTAEAKLCSDPETKSLLTRWVNSAGGEFNSFKNTVIVERSRVVALDAAASYAVKDPTGVIPATVVGGNVGFLPSQVAIGLGMLDVFMVQDPTNYGYKMSADIRIGIVPLRASYNGTLMLTYGPGNL